MVDDEQDQSWENALTYKVGQRVQMPSDFSGLLGATGRSPGDHSVNMIGEKGPKARLQSRAPAFL
jgi:hypothetical protein